LGYEARIRLDELASNAIILAGVFSYERVSTTNTVRTTSNLLDPRGKLGYRHVFGPGLGLEIAAEIALPTPVGSGPAVPAGEPKPTLQAGGSPIPTVGGTVAFLVGF
jgi:hypothetical protein